MYYVIQENLFRETHHKTIINTLERMDLGYEIVKFRPFTHDVEFKTERKDVWCWGSDSMAKVALYNGWNPGSMCSGCHDYNLYAPAYGIENMLNAGWIVPLGEDIPYLAGDEFFIRPTVDSKLFPAKVYTRAEWEDYVKVLKKEVDLEDLFGKSQVLVSTPKNIQQEVRCWIVDGKVITISLYKRGYNIISVNYDSERDFWDFAQGMADRHSPARAYVMDVALAYNEFKIIEINCINAAGFYAANVQKLIESLENTF